MGKAMRLDKLLGHTGWGTRKELKDLCKSGQVTVNGAICRDSSRKVDPEADVVAVGGEIVSYEEYIYLMLYKPSGVVSATEDNVSQTVCRVSIREAACFPSAGWIKIRRASYF